MGPLETGEYASAFARLVEELGCESVWVVEHAVMCVDYASAYPYDPSGRSPFSSNVVLPDPLVWLSYVAAATRRIRLATGILILPQRNPVLLAKAVASLDRISGGRMLLGVGVGWVREEAEAVGTAFEERGRRTDEYLEVMRTLWRERPASFRGLQLDFVFVKLPDVAAVRRFGGAELPAGEHQPQPRFSHAGIPHEHDLGVGIMSGSLAWLSTPRFLPQDYAVVQPPDPDDSVPFAKRRQNRYGGMQGETA